MILAPARDRGSKIPSRRCQILALRKLECTCFFKKEQRSRFQHATRNGYNNCADMTVSALKAQNVRICWVASYRKWPNVFLLFRKCQVFKSHKCPAPGYTCLKNKTILYCGNKLAHVLGICGSRCKSWTKYCAWPCIQQISIHRRSPDFQEPKCVQVVNSSFLWIFSRAWTPRINQILFSAWGQAQWCFAKRQVFPRRN